MTGNRSLDDFLGTNDEADEENAADGDRTGATAQPTVAPSETDAPAADGTDVPAADGTDVPAADEVASPNETGDDTAVAGATDAPTDTVAEPRTTLRWTADRDDCPACGSRVNRQWRDGDRFVCADCKEW